MVKIIGEIQSVAEDSYQGKRGQVKQHIVTVSDRGEAPRMRSNIDLMLTDDQAAKFPNHDSKLVGKPITIAVMEMAAGFAGRMRIRGEILEFKP